MIPFVDRAPSKGEIERLRLILSTYQDGTGMLVHGGATLPGWRDFERSVALAFGGAASESKAIFDVVLSAPAADGRPQYGISCKMRRELNRVVRDGRVTIELSNAAGEFWSALRAREVSEATLSERADIAGVALDSVVRAWHQGVSHAAGGEVDIGRSYYLVLLWNKDLDYQLFQFPLDLWDASRLKWSVPSGAKRLCGHDGNGDLIEWYFGSGGQLKLYPLATTAIWRSDRFRLEPLPATLPPAIGKAATYFPDHWAAATSI